MPIPDFQSIMLPLLKFSHDQLEHNTKEAVAELAKYFKLSDEDLTKLLPSGTQKTFSNRVFWAKAYLKMAGLIENTKRAHFKITPKGFKVLQENPKEINLKFLKQFPEYIELTESWKKEKGESEKENIDQESINIQTPEEIIEISYQNIRKSLAQDLIAKVKTCSSSFFEKLVVELLVKMGYGGSLKDAGKAIGKSGDEGIDGIIKGHL